MGSRPIRPFHTGEAQQRGVQALISVCTTVSGQDHVLQVCGWGRGVGAGSVWYTIMCCGSLCWGSGVMACERLKAAVFRSSFQ